MLQQAPQISFGIVSRARGVDASLVVARSHSYAVYVPHNTEAGPLGVSEDRWNEVPRITGSCLVHCRGHRGSYLSGSHPYLSFRELGGSR